MQVRNLKTLFDVTDVVDDVQGVVDDTVQRTTDNLTQARQLEPPSPLAPQSLLHRGGRLVVGISDDTARRPADSLAHPNNLFSLHCARRSPAAGRSAGARLLHRAR